MGRGIAPFTHKETRKLRTSKQGKGAIPNAFSLLSLSPSKKMLSLGLIQSHFICVSGLFISFPTRENYGEGNGSPLQYSCLENPMDGGAWEAEVHAKGRTRLSGFPFTFHFHALEKEMATHSSVLA